MSHEAFYPIITPLFLSLICTVLYGHLKKMGLHNLNPVFANGEDSNILLNGHNGPVYKTNFVRTKSLSDHGPDQIWLCKLYSLVPKIWSGLRAGPAHVQGPRSDRIWSSTKSGYVNAPCSSDQTKSLTFGGKSQSSNKNCNSATWWKLVKR